MSVHRMKLFQCTAWIVSLWVYIHISQMIKSFDLWEWADLFPQKCTGPARNNTGGVKVLVAGMAKMGTRSMVHALNDIGINAYHGEDFAVWPWRQYLHETSVGNKRLCRTAMGNLFHPHYDPLNVMAMLFEGPCKSASSRFYPIFYDKKAAAHFNRVVSTCPMEAVALDGIDKLFWPLYEGSPDVKVITLFWRAYSSHRRSSDRFGEVLRIMIFQELFFWSSFTSVPWVFLLKPLDYITGAPISSRYESGTPPVTESMSPLVFLAWTLIGPVHQFRAWQMPSLDSHVASEFEYNETSKVFEDIVPADRLMRWDPRKNTYEELCKFTGVSPCPRSGKVPRAINTFVWPRSFPLSFHVVNFVAFFLHWVNWKLACAALSFCARFIFMPCHLFLRCWRSASKVKEQ